MVEYDLREWIPGTQPQSTKESIIKAFKEDLKKCNSGDPAHLSQNGLETIESVRLRTRTVLERYIQYSDVIAVCHGVVIESQVGGIKVKYGGVVEISI